MGAVKVGRCVAIAEIEWVVAVVEETETALLVESVRIRVGEADLKAVAHALIEVELESVVGGDASGLVGDGLRRVADVGNAEVDVTALVVLQIRLAVGEVGKGKGVRVGDEGVPVAVDLAVNG